MPFLSIQARRSARSESFGEIGRVGSAPGNCMRDALVVAHELDAGKLRGLRIEPLEEALGNEMRVDVDDELRHWTTRLLCGLSGDDSCREANSASCPRLSRASPLPYRGDKPWMAGTSPAMTWRICYRCQD